MNASAKTKTILLNFFVILVGVLVLFAPANDPDFGWHYKYGQYVVEHGTVLKDNIFSYTLSDYKWANSYWLSETIMYLLYNSVGTIGMTLIFSLVYCIILWYLINKTDPHGVTRIPVYFFTLIILTTAKITVRPMFFSSLFLLLETYVLLYNKRAIKFLPIMFLFWVNMHADFMLGIFILGIYTIYTSLLSIVTERKVTTTALGLSLTSLTCLLVTLINPYGFSLWQTLMQELLSPQFSVINEWTPLLSLAVKDFGVYAFIWITLSVYMVCVIDDNKLVNTWHTICAIVFLTLTVKSFYFLRVFLLISTLPFLRLTGRLLADKLQNAMPPKPMKTLFALVSISVLLVLVSNFVKNIYTSSTQITSTGPYGAVQYLKAHPIAGNMLNSYDWGGYLIWQLPEYKTFIDGRMAAWTIHGKSFLIESLKVSKLPNDYPSLVEKYIEQEKVMFVLMPNNSPLTNYLLSTQPTIWHEVYKDDISIIIKKDI